jgi:rubrerythrin
VSSKPEAGHLNAHHRDTLSRLFQHPVGHNIEWHDVLSLLEAVATVEETHSGKFLVTLGNETETFEAPRHKDIDAQQVVDLRRMLKGAGYEPDAEGAEPS